MSNRVSFTHNGRSLEIRGIVTGGEWQIWICDKGRRVYLYGVIPFQAHDSLGIDAELHKARNEVERDLLIVPEVRTWPTEIPVPLEWQK